MKKIWYLLLMLPSLAFADSKVSDLTEQTLPKTTDYMYLVANSTSMKVQVGSLLNLPGASTSYMLLNSTNSFLGVIYSSASVSYLGISSTPWTSTMVSLSSQAASNIVNQGQYMFVSSQAASNLVNQGQYLFKSSAASTYAPLVGGVIQNFYLDGGSVTKHGVLTAGSNITLTPSAGSMEISATAGGGGDNLGTHVSTKTISSTFGASLSTLTITSLNCTGNANGGALTTDSSGNVVCSDDASGAGGSGTTISVEDGGSSIVDTSTINFTGAQFVVTDSGGEALVTLDASSVTLLGNNLSASYLTTSSATATYFPIVSSTTLLTTSSATVTYDQKTDSIAASRIAAGSLGSSVIASSIAVNSVGVAQMNFSGTPSASTYARGDGSWATVAGSGDAVLAATQTWSGINTFQSSTTFNGNVFISSGLLASGATGTNGQFLTSGGAGTIPTWTTSAGGATKFSAVIRPESVRLSTDSCVISNSTNALTASLLCDDASEEFIFHSTLLKPYTATSLSMDINFTMLSATSGDIVFYSRIHCVSVGDSEDLDTGSFATNVSSTVAVPGTAGYLGKATIALTDDSCAASDQIIIKFGRSGEASGDTAAGDVEIRPSYIYEP